jgi:hypothetical protein
MPDISHPIVSLLLDSSCFSSTHPHHPPLRCARSLSQSHRLFVSLTAVLLFKVRSCFISSASSFVFFSFIILIQTFTSSPSWSLGVLALFPSLIDCSCHSQLYCCLRCACSLSQSHRLFVSLTAVSLFKLACLQVARPLMKASQ